MLVFDSGTSVAATTRPTDTLVICPTSLQAALAPWLAHRRWQGHGIEVVEPAASAPGVMRQIGEAFGTPLGARLTARPQPPTRLQSAASDAIAPSRFVVLVGDVPVPQVPARVNVHWGSEPDIASDSPYADLDADGVPDVAIGRLPVDSKSELERLVHKILHYETAAGHDLWRRRVSVVAGLGGFGVAADTALEITGRALIDKSIPAGFQTHMTYASWQSPYCPPPSEFREATIAELRSGCLFWVYLGHGQRTLLDDVHVPGGCYPILDAEDIAGMRPTSLGQASPIALLIACHSGAFDAEEDCLAETMLSSAGGPVAVVAASRVTLPYGNAVLCSELMEECFTHRRPTIGEMLLHAKRQSCTHEPLDACRSALDLLARLLSPVPSTLAAERREHALLYNLLGDPLLSIDHPRDVQLAVPSIVRPGDSIVVRGASPVAGRCLLELVNERGRLTFTPPVRDRYDESEKSIAEFAETYRRANDRRLAATMLDVPNGAFSAELSIPPDVRGACYVRAFIVGSSNHAIGAAKILVELD